MFKNRRSSHITLGIALTRLYTLFVLFAVTACQSAAIATPMATKVPATPTSPAPVLSTPSATGPIVLKAGMTVRKVTDLHSNHIRLVLNPVNGDAYLLDTSGTITRISNISASASFDIVANAEEIQGNPTGMAFDSKGTLYVVLNNPVEQTKTQVIVRKGLPNDKGRFNWETLASSEPYPLSNTYFDHLYNGIVVSPDDQWIYINGGSRTDHGEVEDNGGAFPNTRDVALTSKILRLPTNAKELLLPNNESSLDAQKLIFARGTRNAYDMAFAPNGDLFAVDNSPDADYSDELNWIRQGMHYGFPWRFSTQDNPQRLANYDPKKDLHLQSGFYAVDNGFYHNDPTFPPPPSAFTDPVVNMGPDAMKYRGDDGKEYDAATQGKSLSTFTAHRSPLGLVFVTDDSTLPAQWHGTGNTFSVFILSWGAAGGTLSDKGQDLLHMQLTKNGDNYQAVTNEIARRFDYPIDAVLIGNHLYVLEYSDHGAIWEVTFN